MFEKIGGYAETLATSAGQSRRSIGADSDTRRVTIGERHRAPPTPPTGHPSRPHPKTDCAGGARDRTVSRPPCECFRAKLTSRIADATVRSTQRPDFSNNSWQSFTPLRMAVR